MVEPSRSFIGMALSSGFASVSSFCLAPSRYSSSANTLYQYSPVSSGSSIPVSMMVALFTVRMRNELSRQMTGCLV